MNDFEPLNDRVIIEPEEPIKKIGNILIPDTAQKKTLRGKVVAVGPGKPMPNQLMPPVMATKKLEIGTAEAQAAAVKFMDQCRSEGVATLPPEFSFEYFPPRLPMTLRVGDTIIYESFAGNTIEHDGKTYIAFREDEIISKVK